MNSSSFSNTYLNVLSITGSNIQYLDTLPNGIIRMYDTQVARHYQKQWYGISFIIDVVVETSVGKLI